MNIVDFPGFLPECRDVFGGHVVIIEHQPIGFLPEVSQLLGTLIVVDSWFEGNRLAEEES